MYVFWCVFLEYVFVLYGMNIKILIDWFNDVYDVWILFVIK